MSKNKQTNHKTTLRTRLATVLVEDDQIRHVVGAHGVRQLLEDVVAAVDLLAPRKHETHFLQPNNVSVSAPLFPRPTLTKAISREDGSRDVVTTTFGSNVPAVAYSSSMCVAGAASSPPASSCIVRRTSASAALSSVGIGLPSLTVCG